MAISLNLIPDEFKTESALYKIYKAFGVASIVGTLVFFVAIFIVTVFIIINANRLRGLQVRQDQLKKEVQSYSDVESNYTLLKKRAGLINEIDKIGMARYEDFYRFINSEGTELSIQSADVAPQKMELAAYTPSIKKVLSLVEEIVANDVYTGITLNNFGFDRSNGFILDFTFNY